MMQHDRLLNLEKGSARLVSGKNATVTRPVIMPLAIVPRGNRQASAESTYKCKKRGSVIFSQKNSKI